MTARSTLTRWAAVASAAGLLAAGCTQPASTASGAASASFTGQNTTGEPTEYVGMTASIPLDPASPQTVLDPILGDSGEKTTTTSLGEGLRLLSAPHPATSAERVLTFEMDTAANPKVRRLATVPISLANGAVFITAVRAALARGAEVDRTKPDSAEPARLELRSRSSKGGSIVISVIDDPNEPPRLEVAANTPVTSLTKGHINQPAADDPPTESLYGLVWFHVGRDEFNFFVNRAYGITAGKAQNFKDFELEPHNWLRLTVTPRLNDKRVDVGFEVVALDGARVAFAKAPASLVAGEQFMNTVFRGFDTMAAQEAKAPGSSLPWEAPFYYDDPSGGGVVEVIAKGAKGVTSIAYSVESPRTVLHDVDFLPYQGTVKVPANWDAPDPTCAKLGSTEAAAGRFDVKFEASAAVRGAKLKAPLKGTVYGSVYKAADVRITGPIDGAKPVANFTFPGVDSTAGPSKAFPIDTQLPTGAYQILGFMDIDGNTNPASPDPDVGDPVFIPIGGFTMTCARQPVTAEFAITLPAGR